MMRLCSIADCGRKYLASGYCRKHWLAWNRYGDPLEVKIRERGTGSFKTRPGYLVFNNTEGNFPRGEHTIIAEKAFGRSLPKGVVVHHANGNGLDNRNENLVICTQSYHMLIHRRMRAMAACGEPTWRRCPICKQYDAPENVNAQGRHRACHTESEKRRKHGLANRV